MSLSSLNEIDQAARNSASESENPTALLAPSANGNDPKLHSFHSYYAVKREPSHRYDSRSLCSFCFLAILLNQVVVVLTIFQECLSTEVCS